MQESSTFEIPSECSRITLEFTFMAQFIRHNLSEIRKWIDESQHLQCAAIVLAALKSLEEKEVTTTSRGDNQGQIMLDAV
jgi:hypothetical protein